MASHCSITQYLLDPVDLFLNLASYLFTGTFSFQLMIIAEFPGDLLDITLHLVKLAFPSLEPLELRNRIYDVTQLCFISLASFISGRFQSFPYCRYW